MKPLAPFCLLIIIGLASMSSVGAQTPPTSSKREVLTNNSIINLTKARFKERTIITLIHTSETAFDISTPMLVELKKNNVSERVISEMIERTNSGETFRRLTTLRDDEFFSKDDDAFFNGSSVLKELPSEKEARKREEDMKIFGSQSGSGSKSRTRGTGPNNDRSDQTEIMGSASVRIIKPPGEAGAAPKLERAAKLENQDVLDLIQAGFSEGTIIRKIETSQVDFDMSPKSIQELRKNRVSERIIKAMTKAMDESK